MEKGMNKSHSLNKVPNLYMLSCELLEESSSKGGSLKNLLYNKCDTNVKAIFSIVNKAIKKETELDEIIKQSEILDKEPTLNPWLTRVLVTELLWGRKKIIGDAKAIKIVKTYEETLRGHFSCLNCSSDKEVTSEYGQLKPRYVRINTIKISLEDAVSAFQQEGWKMCTKISKDPNKLLKSFSRKVSNLQDEFLIDLHVSNLLIFPPKTEFWRHELYRNGSIILQDKASCLPVELLNPPRGSIVLDMCAAPGMKTTQLAAVLNNEGILYAVERDNNRFLALEKIVKSSGATCVKLFNDDALSFYKNSDISKSVQYILVDPTCSCSGIVDPSDPKNWKDLARLNKLAGLQIKILRQALTKYPNAKRVVYSTCSLYIEENEEVVRQVLETNHLFKLISASDLLKTPWKNIGKGKIGSRCLYAKPNEDYTNGFFVAVFERLTDDEINEFFNEAVFIEKRNEQLGKSSKKLSNIKTPKSKKDNHEHKSLLRHNKKKKKKKKNKVNIPTCTNPVETCIDESLKATCKKIKLSNDIVSNGDVKV